MSSISKVVNHKFTSKGDGLWGLKAKVKITYTKIVLSFYEDDGAYAEIRAYHDLPFVNPVQRGPLLNMPDSDNGLLYTDSGALKALRAVLMQDPLFSQVVDVKQVYGSEQGMQGEDYLSCDASLLVSNKRMLAFIKSLEECKSILTELALEVYEIEE